MTQENRLPLADEFGADPRGPRETPSNDGARRKVVLEMIKSHLTKEFLDALDRHKGNPDWFEYLVKSACARIVRGH